MKIYLLNDNEPHGKLWLAIGSDCVEAAKHLIAKIGGKNDVERFSVSGSWYVADGSVIEVSRWWPLFTAWPGRHAS